MSRSKSSERWLKQHFNDPFVKKAQLEGLRSRSAYKLLEIQQKHKLIRPGMTVVDLGAAPGGWSQVAAKLVGEKGIIYAIDILSMDPLPNVHFIQGDFREEEILEELLSALHTTKIDLIISDMAPNLSGMRSIDQPRAMVLAELALDFVQRVLKYKGNFLTKVFQGTDFEDYLKQLRQLFDKVIIFKPAASRSTSNEIYLIALGYRLS